MNRRSVLAGFFLCAWSMSAHCVAAANFAIEPSASTNLNGQTLVLSLLQDGGPLIDAAGFLWRRGGEVLANDGRISGAETDVLTVESLNFEDAGTYTVALTNMANPEEPVPVTASAQVHVVGQPGITGELRTETKGTDITFSVVATGGLLSYQWLWQGAELPGATTATLRFTNAFANANAGYYNVRVSNPANPAGIIAPAALLVTKPTPPGKYQGIFYEDEGVAAESTGFFQFALSASQRAFSGRLTLGSESFPFSGKFSPEHLAEVEVARKTREPLLLSMQLLTINNTPQVVGKVAGDGWNSSLLAHRLHFSKAIPTSLAGRYTLALVNTNTSTAAPNGDVVGTLMVGDNGGIVFAGKAADGSRLSQKAGLSRNGDWPLYIVNKPRGLVAGWLRIARQTGGSIHGGNIAWLKDAGPDALYPEGFGLLLQPVGSTYIAPTTNSILTASSFVASIYGGDLFLDSEPFWTFIPVALRAPLKFVPHKSPERLSLSVKRATGLASGAFTDITTGRRTPITAVVLQQQTSMRGFFLSTNAAGAFTLTR